MLAAADTIEQDAGRRDANSVVARLCAVQRTQKPVDELIRFVLAPDGNVVPDLKRNLPGRGVWVTANRASIAAAVKSRVFGRAFKADVVTAADLDGLIQRLLERHVLDALAMAYKAGQTVCGFTRVEEALASHLPVTALIEAFDASADGSRKIMAATFRHRSAEAADIVVVNRFASEQLDLAFGRSNVVHAALLGGSASKSFLARWRRLEQYMDAGSAAVQKVTRSSPRARD